jgi:type IX secretion system PorP/SprF family membrane protein
MKASLKFSLLILLALTLLPHTAQAQQDPLYSQFMYNRLALNPAYAGAHEQLSFLVMGRRQWSGFNGAPSTNVVSVHAPTPDNRHGFGLNMVNDHVGYTHNTSLTAAYAYRIPIGTGALSLGLNMGMRAYRLNFSQVPLQDQGDAAFANGTDFRKTYFSAGPGVYFQNAHFFLGASVPDMIPHKLYDKANAQLDAHTVMHSYWMGGAILKLTDFLKFKPSVLLRVAKGAPLGLDLNAAFLVKDIVGVGASWRPGNALALMLQAYIVRNVSLGYAYDLGLNATRDLGKGSHELFLRLDLGLVKGTPAVPKLF